MHSSALSSAVSFAAVCSAILVPIGAHAVEIGNYRSFDDGWTITRHEESCSAARAYEDEDFLFIHYEPKDDLVILSVSDPDATSLIEGEKVSLYVQFVGSEGFDDGWGAHSFSITKRISDGSNMSGRFEGRTMMADISKNDIIAFSIDGTTERMVGVYRLDGSARAMKALKECAFEVQGLNIKDPFLN